MDKEDRLLKFLERFAIILWIISMIVGIVGFGYIAVLLTKMLFMAAQ